MITYNLVNDSSETIIVIIEPEGIERFLKPFHSLNVKVSGPSPAFTCKESVDQQGIRTIAFWPEYGQFEITDGDQGAE